MPSTGVYVCSLETLIKYVIFGKLNNRTKSIRYLAGSGQSIVIRGVDNAGNSLLFKHLSYR